MSNHSITIADSNLFEPNGQKYIVSNSSVKYLWLNDDNGWTDGKAFADDWRVLLGISLTQFPGEF
jgi:hypothetical protein